MRLWAKLMTWMINNYHDPVLLKESLDGLDIQGDDVIVDVTFGGGGHSREILNLLSNKGLLLAFDQDNEALENQWDDERLLIAPSNFRFLINFVKFFDVFPVDGVLADLGVSSHQFDIPERGFSIRNSGDLDMRMNQDSSLTAARVVNQYQEKDLYRIFNNYADIKNVKRLVKHLQSSRKNRKINTTGELVGVLETIAPGKRENQFYAQVFQAIRIEVNDEMGALRDMLHQTAKAIRPGGRLVVISYHSIEDRMVKNFIRTGNVDGKEAKDIYGNNNAAFKAITKNPIIPTDEEIERNPRARSAKMRVAEKL